MKNKIFISVASYRDIELQDTIKSMLENAHDASRLHICVLSQDYEHPDLSFVDAYGATLNYMKMDPADSRGPGYARAIIQDTMDESYDYFLQIDAHTKFAYLWDKKIIEEYESTKNQYSDFIFSYYVPAWRYDNTFDEKIMGPVFAIFDDSMNVKFKQYPNGYHKTIGNWFSAHFAFGESRHFFTVPNDPDMTMNYTMSGNTEELSMAIRFFANDIKIIVPDKIYVWTLYYVDKKVQAFPAMTPEFIENLKIYEQNGFIKYKKLITGQLEGIYGIKSSQITLDWFASGCNDDIQIKKLYNYLEELKNES